MFYVISSPGFVLTAFLCVILDGLSLLSERLAFILNATVSKICFLSTRTSIFASRGVITE